MRIDAPTTTSAFGRAHTSAPGLPTQGAAGLGGSFRSTKSPSLQHLGVSHWCFQWRWLIFLTPLLTQNAACRATKLQTSNVDFCWPPTSNPVLQLLLEMDLADLLSTCSQCSCSSFLFPPLTSGKRSMHCATLYLLACVRQRHKKTIEEEKKSSASVSLIDNYLFSTGISA